MAIDLSTLDWSALMNAIPKDILSWIKITLIIISIYFILLIIKNLYMIGTGYRVRKTYSLVKNIDAKLDSLIVPSEQVQVYQEEQQYN